MTSKTKMKEKSDNLTKAELIKRVKEKAREATPAVKRVFFRGLEYKTKVQLKRTLSRMRVTRDGDIRLI